ncbi:hypothetical protein VTL71DRAFT_2361 [Oculimacula yallundae]|uniref:Uncharacterized protein n=1 Tax=Oculimacula yallundae TaxID=86028 RepID=A0ABR4C8Q5_9HELO
MKYTLITTKICSPQLY